MSKRSYNQYCGIAYALDIIGERWTLLIIRELMLGPRRYKDLLEGLPGIGTNLLADRLKKLQEHEIIAQKELPPPAASTVYALTATGEELQPILEDLGAWGTRFLGTPDDEDRFNPRWLLLALQSKFNADRTKYVDKIIEFDIDDKPLYAHINRGTISTAQGSHGDADLVIRADNKSFIKLISGELDTPEKVNDHLELAGETDLFYKLGEWFDAGEMPVSS